MNVILPVRIPDSDRVAVERAMEACRNKLDFTDFLMLAFEYWDLGDDGQYSGMQDDALRDVLRGHLNKVLPKIVHTYAQLEQLTALVMHAVTVFRTAAYTSLGPIVESLNAPVTMYFVRYLAQDVMVRIEPEWEATSHEQE